MLRYHYVYVNRRLFDKHLYECLLSVSYDYDVRLLIKTFNSLDWFFQRPYKRLLENQETGGSRELSLPENDFKTSSTINFPKTI